MSTAEFEADASTRIVELRQAPLLDVCGGEIVVVDGPDCGRRVALAPLTFKIGTGAGCHLRLSDPTVSRLHCQLTPRRDGLRLVDMGSTNGTFVESARVRDADLLTGTNLRVGVSSLRLELGGEPLRVELSKRRSFGSMLGDGIEMRRLYALLERAADSDATVLIQGETGTGKELVAREVHAHSARDKGPFVAVDCGAIAPTVIESELFGHVRGAFSGAVSDRRGLIEEAHGGTLFLDEIGELPLNLQAKLLRALETREVRRVGSNGSRPVNVRVLAATNRPLAQSVNDGTFREDLYYRLAVVELILPPLRSRREDIATLASHFYARFSGKPEPMPEELMATLVARSWPGNVRELRNFVERCVTLGLPSARPSSAPIVADATLPAGIPIDLSLSLKDARDAALTRFELAYLDAALRRAGGNVTRAAAISGVSRRFLQRLIARLGVRDVELELGDDGDDELDET
ncbi:MAG: sigma 54-interacting transcriptional regulator [Polyangiaceae bacterium]